MSRKLQWLCWAGVAAIVGAAALSFWRGDGLSRKVTPSLTKEAAQDTNFARRMARLEADNARVHNELALTRLALEQTAREQSSVKLAAEKSKPAASTPAVPRAEIKRQEQAALANAEQDLQARVETESPDRQWTSEVEGSVRTALASIKVRASVESARCGTSLCTVVISHEQPHSHMELLNTLRNEDSPGFSGEVMLRRHPNPNGGFRTSMYLSKGGERLPELKEALSTRYPTASAAQ